MSKWPITLADRSALMRELAVHKTNFDPSCGHTLVWAPCCGRRTPADTIVSLHGLRTEIRAGNHLPKRDHDWACDGCLHLLVLDDSNGWSWSNLFAALGAPDHIVRHHLAQEIEREARLDTNRRDADRQRQGLEPAGFNPQEIYETAHEHLPLDLSTIPATRRPDV